MSDPMFHPEVPAKQGGASLFSVPETDPPKRGLVFGAIAIVILIAIVAGFAMMRRSSRPVGVLNTVLPADPYAVNIAFSQLAMSESTSLSGGKSTFIDGHVRNSGSETLTGVTMQVLFKNDEGLPPSVETLPLTLIRIHEPYVDTELVGAAPLKPGDEVEFRLIFESVPSNWNQQMPELRVIHLTKR